MDALSTIVLMANSALLTAAGLGYWHGRRLMATTRAAAEQAKAEALSVAKALQDAHNGQVEAVAALGRKLDETKGQVEAMKLMAPAARGPLSR
ncbi:MAG TPA: hypothetical protein VEB22_05945 [Phycisphaerales bacterium]|nr:hypothetical protein [Phycisphaerales bacterium]